MATALHVCIRPRISKKHVSSASQLAEYKRKMHNIWVRTNNKQSNIIYLESEEDDDDEEPQQQPQQPPPLVAQQQQPPLVAQHPPPQQPPVNDVEFVKEVIIISQRNAQINARSRIKDLFNNPLLQMNVDERPFNAGQYY